MKNYSIEQVLTKLSNITLPYNERSQLESLVISYGHLGAILYLDPSIDRPWKPDRDIVMVEKHFKILKEL